MLKEKVCLLWRGHKKKINYYKCFDYLIIIYVWLAPVAPCHSASSPPPLPRVGQTWSLDSFGIDWGCMIGWLIDWLVDQPKNNNFEVFEVFHPGIDLFSHSHQPPTTPNLILSFSTRSYWAPLSSAKRKLGVVRQFAGFYRYLCQQLTVLHLIKEVSLLES